ncbi:TPA: fimbrial chaperone [Escherichia albertii]|uniref:fimbrial chaperone n=1 Tax=Escherichia albertii TaxID=208962 RepID=UPI000743D0AC|nr:fimbrial chaperone [Escherichia albertii]HCQ4576757.1 fimbrial chaperone [Escherichia albertii]
MNKVVKTMGLFLLIMALCGEATAAFVLNGTRFIYGEGSKNIAFEVTNNSDSAYGGQVWLENIDNADERVFMIPIPSFFRIEPKQKQIVRILKTEDELPANQESMFWLNVQEIPPRPTAESGNVLAVAINTRVKVFFRPKDLKGGRKGAESKIRISRTGNGVKLSNPTPYYFALTDVKVGGKPLLLNDAERSALSSIPPFGKVSLGNHALTGKVTVDAINDWGGVESREVELEI